MNKNAIKKYAVWARRELIDRVAKKAVYFGVSAEGNPDPKADAVDGRLLSDTEKKQRAALIAKIEAHGYEQTIEEVAYTWFNRFAALRFMEVNGYLPSHVRVFTNDAGEFKPQILAEAIHLELPGLDKEKVYALKESNDDEALFRYLIVVQCNALNEILPGMFQRIGDDTELLLPDNLLREGSVIERLIAEIPEEDWRDQVQIIGWLYQYYNTEPKDKVFADLKKNIKVTKEKLPAATQLFTPDWIVRYMVENSLGRLWLEGHPNDTLKADWKYYLDEAEQEPEVQKQLAEIRKDYTSIKPEDIRCIDPCMGSGHILCYLFDVLMQIYQDYGHTPHDAVASIVENNLYGLDIDDRAAQLAYFAVMMKARQYDKRFFSRHLQPNVMAIQGSNGIDHYEDATDEPPPKDARHPLGMLEKVLDLFEDAKEYGSLLHIPAKNYQRAMDWIDDNGDLDYFTDNIYLNAWMNELKAKIPLLVRQAKWLSAKYDVVVTNPPYMGAANMSAKLSAFVKKGYPDSKSDLFACFIERCGEMAKSNGYVAMITQQAWMFLSSFENLRKKLLKKGIVNMAHLGARAFEEIGGEVVQTTSMVFANVHIGGYKGIFVRLIEPTTQDGKEKMFLSGENRFATCQENFAKIPGAPVAYWANDTIFSIFDKNDSISNFALLRNGMKTGNNDKFLRLWWEIDTNKVKTNCKNYLDAELSHAKWFPYNKGGVYRKWYGNNDFVVNWENKGQLIFNFANKDRRHVQDYPLELKFVPALSWSLITTGKPAFRYKEGHLSDIAGMSLFATRNTIITCLGLLNSRVALNILQILAPTINFQAGDISRIPMVKEINNNAQISQLVERNIEFSQQDWDSFETSWDFERHPLLPTAIKTANLLFDCYQKWEQECNDRFTTLKQNEEELNRIFIDIYGLTDELTPEVEDKDVTVRKADLGRDIRSFISYAVGCMMGRYSLDVPGVAYAGGEWDRSKYKTFQPDRDAILPICDDEYFDDDIVGRFVEFVKVVYGADTLEENLQFVADALGGRGTPREVIRNYFLTDFYADHVKTYQKRPIYWLFDSGKKNGFKCLVYMHRYRSDTIARIRTDYIHEQQSRYRTAMETLERGRDNAATAAEKVKLGKKLAAIEAQAKELQEYEEKIHHLADQMIAIDLDDGVKHNYALFKDVLAKIK